MDIPSELLRAARVALGIGQRELAAISGVGQRTILRVEQNDPTVSLETRRRLQDAFEKQGIVFIPDDGVSGPGLRIRADQLHKGNLRF
jgi:transcriptional regulator with XRE-family HTH domain